jgi:hypothetical protein
MRRRRRSREPLRGAKGEEDRGAVATRKGKEPLRATFKPPTPSPPTSRRQRPPGTATDGDGDGKGIDEYDANWKSHPFS